MSTTPERWGCIAGYVGYLVSTHGRVSHDGRILSVAGCGGKGYPQCNLIRDGKTTTKSVHRLVALAFIPNPEGKPQINHLNGVKTDNRVENLEWSTGSQNMKHAYATGLKVAMNGAMKRQRAA